MLNGQKQMWVEEHARLIQRQFEQWQQPLGIDGSEYIDYLRDELVNYCDDPLLKALIESMSQERDSQELNHPSSLT